MVNGLLVSGAHGRPPAARCGEARSGLITAHDDVSVRARIEKSTAVAHLKKPCAIRRVMRRNALDQGPLGSPREVRHTRDSDKEAQ
jgi:hypothetical protein